MIKTFSVAGIMSGTSLDGVDLACVLFEENSGKYSFKIKAAETIPYSEKWKTDLKNLIHSRAEGFVKTHVELGKYFTTLVNNFIAKNKLTVDFISSHGHTIFHQPENGFTSQIGDGATICAMTNLPVVCDFRSVDIALGGQGAPLVPVGDKFLFSEYDFCLNLGGIANISFNDTNEKRIAFDICPVNMILNYLAADKNFEYDKNGELAKTGKINFELLSKLNVLDFYKTSPPKSLGYEWFKEYFLPAFNSESISTEDKLRTACEHIAIQISSVVNSNLSKEKNGLLLTGGGTFNKFLVELLKKKCNAKIILPSKEIIEFKEAVIFAFLGLLRMQNKINTLASVTGASKDSIGGAVYLP